MKVRDLEKIVVTHHIVVFAGRLLIARQFLCVTIMLLEVFSKLRHTITAVIKEMLLKRKTGAQKRIHKFLMAQSSIVINSVLGSMNCGTHHYRHRSVANNLAQLFADLVRS